MESYDKGRATRSDWGNVIHISPSDAVELPVPDKSFSLDQYEEIQRGFVPREMEDKWFLYFEGETLYCHRSWTGLCVYEVAFNSDASSARIHSIRFNPEYSVATLSFNADYESAMAVFLIDAILLDLPSEFPIHPDTEINSGMDYWMLRHGAVGNTSSRGSSDGGLEQVDAVSNFFEIATQEDTKIMKERNGEGAILGALVGDAAGATLEFLPGRPTFDQVIRAMSMAGRGPLRTAPGQVTDDGEMTLCLMHALAGKDSFEIEAVAQSYLRWFRSNPFDIGGTTSRGLGGGERRPQGQIHLGMWACAEQLNLGSKANGGLMRVSPLGVWGHRISEEDLFSAAMDECRLTHSHPTCQVASATYCVAIRHLVLNSGDSDGAFASAMKWAEHVGNPEIVSWLRESEQGTEVEYGPKIGYVKIAYCHAFRHLLVQSPYEFALLETLKGGGDTDTNACIVGGLIGALHGVNQIPAKMRQAVLQCDTSHGRPRPPFLQTREQLPSLIHRLLG